MLVIGVFFSILVAVVVDDDVVAVVMVVVVISRFSRPCIGRKLSATTFPEGLQ